jgi:HNH endonuclease
MKRAPDEQRRRVCEHCSAVFHVRPSLMGRYCSRACKDAALWSRPKNDPRPCAVCATVFTPDRSRGDARYCSKACVWKATKGPVYNALIAVASALARGEILRDTGEGRAYRKLNGRHEHRVIAERKIGRPLLPGEIVHHIDGDHRNNDPDNLAVMTQGEHMREHGLGIPGMTLPWEPWKYRRTR